MFEKIIDLIIIINVLVYKRSLESAVDCVPLVLDVANLLHTVYFLEITHNKMAQGKLDCAKFWFGSFSATTFSAQIFSAC